MTYSTVHAADPPAFTSRRDGCIAASDFARKHRIPQLEAEAIAWIAWCDLRDRYPDSALESMVITPAVNRRMCELLFQERYGSNPRLAPQRHTGTEKQRQRDEIQPEAPIPSRLYCKNEPALTLLRRELESYERTGETTHADALRWRVPRIADVIRFEPIEAARARGVPVMRVAYNEPRADELTWRFAFGARMPLGDPDTLLEAHGAEPADDGGYVGLQIIQGPPNLPTDAIRGPISQDSADTFYAGVRVSRLLQTLPEETREKARIIGGECHAFRDGVNMIAPVRDRVAEALIAFVTNKASRTDVIEAVNREFQNVTPGRPPALVPERFVTTVGVHAEARKGPFHVTLFEGSRIDTTPVTLANRLDLRSFLRTAYHAATEAGQDFHVTYFADAAYTVTIQPDLDALWEETPRQHQRYTGDWEPRDRELYPPTACRPRTFSYTFADVLDGPAVDVLTAARARMLLGPDVTINGARSALVAHHHHSRVAHLVQRDRVRAIQEQLRA
ncbi:MAG: hypothetical protein AAGA95_06015 [Pseudomonadota bacterium]